MTIFKDGQLSKPARLLSTAIGLVSAVSIGFFLDDLGKPFIWVLVVLAIVFGYGSAWSGLSEKWGFKPLTNDPLGWRKAKKTYQKKPSPNSTENPDV